MEKIEDIIRLIDAQEKKEAKNTISRYLKNWPWVVGFCIIGVILGYYYTLNSPNIYVVNSRMLVLSEKSSMSSLTPFNGAAADFGQNTEIENQIGILYSYSLFNKAIERLGWDYSWYQKYILYNADLYSNEPFDLLLPPNGINTKNINIEIEAINNNEYHIFVDGVSYHNGYAQVVAIDKKMKYGVLFENDFFNFTINKRNPILGETYLLRFNSVDALTSWYMAKTRIFSDVANIIKVSCQGEVRQKEADFINELCNVFIEYGLENQYNSSENSVEFIDDQLLRIKESLGTAEKNFSNYQKRNRVMSMGQEAQAVYDRIEEIEQERYLTQLQLDYYTELLQYIDDTKKIEELINPSVVGITDPILDELLGALMELYNRRQVLSYSVQEKNPAYILLENEIDIARNRLRETIINQQKTTESKMESIQQRDDEVQKRLTKLPDTEKDLIGIQRDFDLNNQMYTYMLQKKAELSISKASIASEVKVIDKAIVQTARRTGPNLIRNVAAGFIGGGIIPVLVIVLLSLFSNKIKTIEEVEKESRIQVIDGIVKHKYKINLPVLHYPRSGISECFRGLKSNINTILEEPGAKVIAINSLMPGEGKSFISSNLAVVFSKTKKKVLLIGADLHRPTLHEQLEVQKSCGLSEYLNSEKDIEEVITETKIPDLFFIQTGNIPENPSDLLDNERFGKLIEQAKKSFDYIIIDNAPLNLVPDSIVSSKLADISLFLLRMNRSHNGQIEQINRIVDFNRLKPAAIVVNDTSGSKYGYGYGYGNRKKYWKQGYGEYRDKRSKT